MFTAFILPTSTLMQPALSITNSKSFLNHTTHVTDGHPLTTDSDGGLPLQRAPPLSLRRCGWWLIVPNLTAHNVNLLTAPQCEFDHSATAHSATDLVDLVECSQRQHNRINNWIRAHSATAHSATDLVECSQRQHNLINNRIHAHSATAHSANRLESGGNTRWRGNPPSLYQPPKL
ncbi:hypothetical protein J6590_060581 [Homalodisca vitripennis]|nr:hypothetical protein J6590_060581 [Homalodisca vitripennis]